MNLISEETLKDLRDSLLKATTTGITTATGLNFYYLEPGVKTLIPIYHPLLNRIPRYVPTVGGQPVGGTGVHYKALTSIGNNPNLGIPEGTRGQYIQFTTEDFFAPYRNFGVDGSVTFMAEQAGLGLDDNIRLTQWALLATMLNSFEMEVLFGNSGPNLTNGGNGYALGSPSAATIALASGGNMTASKYVKVWYVALTGWGMKRNQGATTGLVLSDSLTTADGTNYTVPAGVSNLSAASNEVQTTGTTLSVKATATAVPGAVGYAWYVSEAAASGGESTASAYFVGITHAPTITVTADPVSTNQAASAIAADNSYSQYDIDGIIPWVISVSGGKAPAPGQSYVTDLGGAGLTSVGDGSVAEIEAAIKAQFLANQITYDEILVAPDVIGPLTTAILSGASSNATRINFFSDDAGRLLGGTLVTEYRSRYSPNTGAKPLPVWMHPWLPNGTILFITIKNPYPEAANAIPAVLRIPTLLDFFSVKWPYVKTRHELGVYLIPTLTCYVPFALGLITGVTP